MPSLFDITAAETRVNLDSQRRGEVSFTVTNTSGQPVRGLARIAPQGAAAPTWFSIVGQAERLFSIAGAQQYTVQIAVPADTPAGTYIFRLDMIGVENPDEFFTEGPSVAFTLTDRPGPPPEPPQTQKGYITSVVGAVVGLLAGITAGIVLALILGVIVNQIFKDLAGVVAIGTLALGPWIGSSLGVYIALNSRSLNWPRETAGIFAAVVFAWTILCFLLLALIFNILTGDTIRAILVLFVVLPLWLIAPGVIARGITLRWKTGAF